LLHHFKSASNFNDVFSRVLSNQAMASLNDGKLFFFPMQFPPSSRTRMSNELKIPTEIQGTLAAWAISVSVLRYSGKT
jgi:hypothetical protein